MTAIPQADPGAGFRAHQAEIERAVARVLASGTYILGPEVAAFEQEFAAALGWGQVVTCGSGTDAIELALRTCGIGVGAAVATVSFTAVATVAAIERAGAEPCLVDLDPETYTIDVDDLAALIERRAHSVTPIRAVVAVHLYGQAADLDRLGELCRRHRLELVEDCSQAHGARYGAQALGTFGTAGCFSFYPTKNLGAFGDGGAVWVPDRAVAATIKGFRQYGWDSDRVSRLPGQNSRMDALQAAVLRVKLPYLEQANARRAAIAAHYDEALEGGCLITPRRRAGATHVFHQYVIRATDRDAVRRRLADAGVGTAIHYPLPVHLHPAYRGRVELGRSACRASEAMADSVFSVPIQPEMRDSQVEIIAGELRREAKRSA